MEGLELKYDGVVLQHAGEILIPGFDDTRAIRSYCVESYFRSLHSFAFGVIFGSRLITTRALPKVGDGTPGETLLTDSLYFQHVHERRPVQATAARPESGLINDPDDKANLKPLLRSLGSLVGTQQIKFCYQHMVREVLLGFKPRGDEWPRNDEGLFLFADRENFDPNVDKESAIDPMFVESARREVNEVLGDVEKKKRAPKGALAGYIRRNVVAHVAIHPVINRKPDLELDPKRSARIFHATRSGLTDFEKVLWKVRDIIVPGMLEKMIEDSAGESNPREVLVSRLRNAAVDPKFSPVRKKLALAVELARAQNDAELARLLKDLQSSLLPGAAPEPQRLLVGADDQQYKDAIAALKASGAGPRRELISNSWFTIFPELQFKPRAGVEPA